jgi:hypothetical protein
MFGQLFLAQKFYHKHLNVYKMYEYGKNQMPYYNVIFF